MATGRTEALFSVSLVAFATSASYAGALWTERVSWMEGYSWNKSYLCQPIGCHCGSKNYPG